MEFCVLHFFPTSRLFTHMFYVHSPVFFFVFFLSLWSAVPTTRREITLAICRGAFVCLACARVVKINKYIYILYNIVVCFLGGVQNVMTAKLTCAVCSPLSQTVVARPLLSSEKFPSGKIRFLDFYTFTGVFVQETGLSVLHTVSGAIITSLRGV